MKLEKIKRMLPHLDHICQGLWCISVKVSHYILLHNIKSSLSKFSYKLEHSVQSTQKGGKMKTEEQ